MGNIDHSGNKEYESLYKSYFKKFYNYGKKFTTDTSVIEDSIQELFLDIWTRQQTAIEIRSKDSYYFSSFRYILFRKIRTANDTRQLHDVDDEPEFSVEHKIIADEMSKELAQKLQTALNTLTSRQREAIFLRFYIGLSYEEVADVLNITIKASYKIMARSLVSLKEKLALSVDSIFLLLYLLIVSS